MLECVMCDNDSGFKRLFLWFPIENLMLRTPNCAVPLSITDHNYSSL